MEFRIILLDSQPPATNSLDNSKNVLNDSDKLADGKIPFI